MDQQVRVFASFRVEDYRHRLRLLRRLYDENQTEFAKRVGIAYKKWSHYERGYPIPRETAFILHEKIPGISIDWLWFGYEGNLDSDTRERIRRLEREEVKAARALQKQARALLNAQRRKISKTNAKKK